MRTETQIEAEIDVPVRMKDGTVLRADIYRPTGPGPYPVLLLRTAYGKSQRFGREGPHRELAAAGYIVAIQDVRGRYASEGEFSVFSTDIDDGYDSVQWAAGLGGSTGDVGMFGTSYMGVTQWLAAASRPPALKAIMPVNAGPNFYEGFRYYGGAFQIGDWLNWAIGNALDTAERLGVEAPEVRHLNDLTEKAVVAASAGDPRATAGSGSKKYSVSTATCPWATCPPSKAWHRTTTSGSTTLLTTSTGSAGRSSVASRGWKSPVTAWAAGTTSARRETCARSWACLPTPRRLRLAVPRR